jgi:hypothetical protein
MSVRLKFERSISDSILGRNPMKAGMAVMSVREMDRLVRLLRFPKESGTCVMFVLLTSKALSVVNEPKESGKAEI